MKKSLLPLCSLLILLSFDSLVGAQTPGLPQFSPIHSDSIDNVKIRDGGILIELPVRQKSALIPFSYSLATQVNVTTSGSAVMVSGLWGPGVWVSKVSPTATGPIGQSASNLFSNSMQFTCPNGQQTTQYYAFTYTDPLGGSHFVGQPPNGQGGIWWDSRNCLGANYSAWTQDGQYYVTAVQGNQFKGSAVDTGGNGVEQLSDTNGNVVSWSVTGTQTDATITWSDSTGAAPLTQIVTANGPLGYKGNHIITDTHSWIDENSNTQSYIITYAPYTQQTNFQCTSYTDIAATAQYYPSSISTPEGNYTITYEPTPGTPTSVTGRIAKIVFPSGASIQYSYTGGNNDSGLFCGGSQSQDPSTFLVPLLTRTLTDTTGKTRVWKYNTMAVTNSTVVTDPNGNDTVYGFALGLQNSLARVGEAYSITSYQGSYSSGIPLKAIVNCYNATLPCNTVPPNPFTDLQVYVTIPGLPQYLSEDTTFEGQANAQGFPLPIEKKVYDTNGSLITDTKLTYGSYSSGSCVAISPSIINRVCTSITTDSGGHTASQTRNTYDTRGNLTASSQWTSGTNWLTRYVTPNSNGTSASTTDANGTITQYTYGDCNGTFPTQVSTQVSASDTLTTNMAWNCSGGVMMSSSDTNGQVTIFDYKDYTSGVADPFWRLKSKADPLGNVTTGTYTPTTFEQALTFNSNSSTVDVLTTSDGFGRTLLTQKRRAPGTTQFDTVSIGYEQGGALVTGYDGNGNAASNSLQCVSGTGVGCPSSPSTTQTYDGLNRPLVTTDGGGGTVSRTYQKTDVLEVVGPAPSGEHTKQHQYEYDGIGRLKSVCEILSTGGTSCGQQSAASGYGTSYSYSVPTVGGSQMVVTQGAQQRTYQYDGLNRLISESNPETGTTTYTYDNDGTCGTSKGDLVKKVDASNNVTCYAYDGLHRLTGVSYPSGPYATSTPSKTFIYDATTFSCTPNPAYPNGPYVKGRLAEAFTGPSSSKITDIAYCYTPRGETSDAFESTPNSKAYYHTTASYWANGVLNVLSGVPSHNAWTFAVDSEGRSYSAVDGTTTNLVTATSYNAAGQPTGVSLGSGDSDTYTYDANTGRMKTYEYNIGSTPKYVIGTLGWNQNWSLGSLVISDAFNSANAQTCGYSYDDIARLQSVSCGPTSPNGTTWGQTFSYDAYGNITKSVPPTMTGIAWQPGYNTNNRYTLGGTSYDGNGNLTADTFNTYAWDSNANTIGINLGGSAPINLTYDAFDRVVEENNSGIYKQILYGPTGGKLALMAKQVANNVFLPLPGGEQATYTNSTIRFRHYDWQGSSRFESNMGEAEYGDAAYAPFGETYAIGKTPYLSFTGQQQDTISGTYDFLRREYNPTQGRWISPDPVGLSAANPSNPQTWNRYAYVLNNPLSAIDPLGLFCVWDNGSYDGNDDGTTGGKGQCENLGGTWFNGSPSDWDSNASDWSGQASKEFAGWAQGINPNVESFGDPSGTPDVTVTGIFSPVGTNSGPGFLRKLNTCVVANAKNYSLGGAANLIFNTQIPGSSLASNSITDAYTLFTGQDGLSSSLWSATKTGFQWAAAASPPVMTNGPSSFSTINPARGSPQAILGNGTNYQGFLASAKRLLKSGAQLKLAVDAGLTGALVLNCSLGQIK